jgi:peptidoglycan/LPS O-acetylase OafA/YrhL
VNKRFEVLDGTRGLAALVVMIFHLTALQQVFERGWLAVDLFFILSGFVITYSYGDKIKQGLTFKDFLVARFLRLWPLMALGLTLGLAASALHHFWVAPDGGLAAEVIAAFFFNLAFLPYISETTQVTYGDVIVYDDLFPLNAPAWSLFFEMLIGLVYFGLSHSRRRRRASSSRRWAWQATRFAWCCSVGVTRSTSWKAFPDSSANSSWAGWSAPIATWSGSNPSCPPRPWPCW